MYKVAGLILAGSLSAALGLFGCESVQEIVPLPSSREEPVVQGENKLADLLEYYDAATRLPARKARHEYQAQRKLMISGACDEQRLRTAMLLTNSALRRSFAKQRAAILQPCIESHVEQDSEITQLAHILRLQLAEILKSQSAERKLIMMREKLKASDDEHKALNGQIEVLNKKLDALKSIERSIRER